MVEYTYDETKKKVVPEPAANNHSTSPPEDGRNSSIDSADFDAAAANPLVLHYNSVAIRYVGQSGFFRIPDRRARHPADWVFFFSFQLCLKIERRL